MNEDNNSPVVASTPGAQPITPTEPNNNAIVQPASSTPEPVQTVSAERPNPASIYPTAVSGGPLADAGAATMSKIDTINENMRANTPLWTNFGLFGLTSVVLAYGMMIRPLFGDGSDLWFGLGSESAWGFVTTFFAWVGFTFGLLSLSNRSKLGIAAIAIGATIGISSLTANITYLRIQYEKNKVTNQTERYR